jgi:CDGSH-type Zn-finger protein
MPDPKSPQKLPYKIILEPGRKYFWCSCGEAKTQPFCDGSHKTQGEFHSVPFEVIVQKEYYLCGCKHTKLPPYCDGSHKNI